MEKKVLKKMERFVELSGKFSKSESEVFPNEESRNTLVSNMITSGISFSNTFNNDIILNCDTFVINGKSIYVDENNNVKAKDAKPLTRAEKILAEAHIKAKLSDEFDEYNKLRVELMDYFNACNKLIENGK